MKAEISLEIIIALVILLAISVVIIGIFFNKMPSVNKESAKLKDLVGLRNFESECEKLCSGYQQDKSTSNLAKFCYTKITGGSDFNRNGVIDKFKANTELVDVCEDMIYCFHTVSCEKETGSIDWSDCRKAVCDEYVDAYQGDQNKADQKVRELFPGSGSCDISEDENWWEMYFGENPCIFPPDELRLRNCNYNGVDEVTCETNCKKDNQEIIFIVADDDLQPLSQATLKHDGIGVGSIIFEGKRTIKVKTIEPLSNLDPDTSKWNVIFICEPFGNYLLKGVSR